MDEKRTLTKRAFERLRENIIAEDVFAETLESALGQSALFVHLLFRLFRNKLDDLFLESIDEMIALLLGMLFGVYCVMEAIAVFLLEVLVDGFIERERRNSDFLGLELGVQFLDGGDDFLNLRVAELESVGDGFFGNFEGTGFHHDDG